MTFTRPNIIRGAVLAALASGAFLATSAPASAAVVCNRWGECWRTRVAYAYPPRLGVVVRDDALDTEITAPLYRPLSGNRAGLDIRV